jgi:hypothetical protein
METQEQTYTDKKTAKPTRKELSALPEFHYSNGYTLSLADLGKAGVKIELADRNEGSAAVILPPDKTEECSRWLSKTIAQRSHLLPEELLIILDRLLKGKRPTKILERGDKKIIKESIKILKAPG